MREGLGADPPGLLPRLRAGDPRAFEELVIAYQHRVFGVALRMLGNRAEAEEIAQEVFLRAHRAIADFRGEARLGTWLYAIASRLCLNRLASPDRRLAPGDDPPIDVPAFNPDAPGPAHLAGCAECRRELAGLLRTVKLVRAMDPVHAPAGFVDRVVAAAQPAPGRRRLGRRLMRPWPTLPLGAAALLLIGGLAVLLFRGSPEQQRAAHDQFEAPRAPSSERNVAAPRSVEAPPAAVTAAPRSDTDLSKNYSEPPKSESMRAKTAAPTTKTDAPSPRARAERAQATAPNAARDSVAPARA